MYTNFAFNGKMVGIQALSRSSICIAMTQLLEQHFEKSGTNWDGEVWQNGSEK